MSDTDAKQKILAKSRTHIAGGDSGLAEKLCRHIVGMKPTAVGTDDDLIKSREARKAVELKTEATEISDATQDSGAAERAEEGEEAESEQEALEAVDEELLVLQDYVFDQDLKVGDVLRENNMEITKFWRFECGEELQESKAQQ